MVRKIFFPRQNLSLSNVIQFIAHILLYIHPTTMTTFFPQIQKKSLWTNKNSFILCCLTMPLFCQLERNAPTPPTQSVPWYPSRDHTRAFAAIAHFIIAMKWAWNHPNANVMPC